MGRVGTERKNRFERAVKNKQEVLVTNFMWRSREEHAGAVLRYESEWRGPPPVTNKTIGNESEFSGMRFLKNATFDLCQRHF